VPFSLATFRCSTIDDAVLQFSVLDFNNSERRRRQFEFEERLGIFCSLYLNCCPILFLATHYDERFENGDPSERRPAETGDQQGKLLTTISLKRNYIFKGQTYKHVIDLLKHKLFSECQVQLETE